MAKKELTYADQAKALIKKYSRASFDATEKAELDGALKALADEQEQFRQANGMNNDQQQFAEGGGLFDSMSQYQQDSGNSYGFTPYQSNQYSMPAVNLNQNTGDAASLSFGNAPQVGQEGMSYSPYKTSIIPSLVSGATSLIGNMYLSKKAGEQPYTLMKSPRVNAQEVSLQAERDAAKRRGVVAAANAKQNVKNTARTRGEYLSNVGATQVGLDRNLSDVYGQSYQREAQMNAAERARAQQINAQMAAQEAQYNANIENQAMSQRHANQMAYQSAAMQAIPQTIQDINAIRGQDRMISSMGQDYGLFMQEDPNRKWYQPKQVTYQYRGQ